MNKRHYLSMEVDNKNVKIRNILNKDFLEVELYAVADHYPNRNNSSFTLPSMQDALPSFVNKPILGSFKNDDFQGHESNLTVDETGETYFDNSKPYDEVPLGLITESSKIEIVKGADGNNWIRVTGYLWVKYATKQILSLLRKRKGRTKVSIECEVLESYKDEKGIEIIEKFNLLGITILGSYKGITGSTEIQEGIKGASMRVLNFSSNPDFKDKLAQLTFAVQQMEEANKNILNQNNQSEEAVENELVDEIGFENDDKSAENTERVEMDTVIVTDPVTGVQIDVSDDRKEKSPMFHELTVREKMDILNDHFKAENEWIMDCDNEFVYVEGEKGTYRIPYHVNADEEGRTVSIDFDRDKAEKVVRTWKVYSDSETHDFATETNKMDDEKIVTMSENQEDTTSQVENFAQDGTSEAIEQETGIVMVMDAHEDDKDDKEDGCHCEQSCEGENPDGEKAEFADGPQEKPVKEPAPMPHEDPAPARPSVEPHDKPSDTGENQYKTDYEPKDEEGTKPVKPGLKEFVKLGDEQVNIDELLERYTALSADYVELNNKFSSMEIEFTALKTSAENARKESLNAFAKSMIDKESFTEEKKNSMFNSVSVGIEDGSLADEDAVKSFAINMIAMALYEAREAGQLEFAQNEHKEDKSEKTEFVQNIVKPAHEKSKLAAATEALKNL